MKISVACDHRGYEAKKRVLPLLRVAGHQVEDFGCDAASNCDYPDYAAPAARAVADGRCEVGILFDGSGIGMCIVANKIPGIRAALVHDELTASRAREHNHCNVLCLGTDLLTEDHIKRIVEIFLSTPFVSGRHDRRVAKVKQLEEEMRLPAPPAASTRFRVQMPVDGVQVDSATAAAREVIRP